MNNNRYYYMVITAAALILLVGFSAYASEMDQRIEKSIQDSHVFKTYLKDDAIRTQSRDGVVTLTGAVAEEDHKTLAQETALSTPGVARVDDQLEVKSASSAGEDAWIGTKIKAALLYHRNVSGTATKVEVKNGIVTLRGEVENQAQMDLTTEYAKDIEGVKQVHNEMTVASANPVDKKTNEPAARTLGDKIDDASITAQVKGALMIHRSTSGIGTKVDTRDGVVTLSGKAQSGAEKDLVTKITSDINGVKKVVNNMNVQGQS